MRREFIADVGEMSVHVDNDAELCDYERGE